MMCVVVIPDTGSSKLLGYGVQRDRSAAMRRFGEVLEGARTTYWRLSAMENLMNFGRLKGVRDKYLKPRAERLLKELDMAQDLDSKTDAQNGYVQRNARMTTTLSQMVYT